MIFQLRLHGWTMSRHRRHRQLKCQNIVNFSKVKLMAKILLLSDGVLCRSEHIKWLPNWRWETGTLLAWPRVMNHPMKISEITVRMFCQIGTIWICSSSDCNIIIFVTPGKMRCVDLEIKINLLTEFQVMQQCYIELENIFLFAKTCGHCIVTNCIIKSNSYIWLLYREQMMKYHIVSTNVPRKLIIWNNISLIYSWYKKV